MRTNHELEGLAPEQRPRDPRGDGAGLRLEPLENGGDCPDAMPQAVRVTDGEGRSCLYVRPRRASGPTGQNVVPWLSQKTAHELVEAIIAPRGEYEDTIRKSVAAELRRQAELPGHEAVKDRLLQMAVMTEP
jgi:hypothetical protein